jgi:hypothetical protein
LSFISTLLPPSPSLHETGLQPRLVVQDRLRADVGGALLNVAGRVLERVVEVADQTQQIQID